MVSQRRGRVGRSGFPWVTISPISPPTRHANAVLIESCLYLAAVQIVSVSLSRVCVSMRYNIMLCCIAFGHFIVACAAGRACCQLGPPRLVKFKHSLSLKVNLWRTHVAQRRLQQRSLSLSRSLAPSLSALSPERFVCV